MVRKHSLSKRGKHLAACCALALSAATSGSCIAAPIVFNISETQLSEALLSFARQADVSIIFSADSDFDVQLDNVFSGEFEPRQLLDLLLQGTALEAEFIHSDVIAIRPMPCLLSASCRDEDLSARDEQFFQLASNPMLEQMLVVGRTMTGSRIRRTEFNGTAPVDIISAFDIELAGAQTIGDLLRDLPSVVGNSTSTSISNGGDGTASVTLRGLPASNTLVLVNGRRVANDGLAGESFDLNSLAPSSVERIEVLKSGSSAVYGSDAIAGVINIILKKEYDGLQVDTYRGSSSENDLQTTTSSFSFGRVFDHSSFFLSGTIYDQGEILSRERAVSANTDTRLLGGEDQRSSATPNGRVTLANGQVLTLANNSANPLSANDFRTVNDADLFNFAQFSTAIVPSSRKSLYGSFNFDVGDKSTAYLDYGFTSTEASAQLAPVPIFTAFESIPLTVSANNVFNPFGEEIADVRKRLLELGPRAQTNKADAHRAAFGIQGREDTVHWDINWHWSKTDARQSISNLLDAERLQRALGGPGECAGLAIDGCEPVDLFSASGLLPQGQQQFILSEAITNGFFKLYGGSANVAFTAAKLRAGKLNVAAGLEYRRESTAIGPQDPDLITLGGANLAAFAGNRSVREVYVETLVPLLRTEHGREKLSLELASRYSHYSDFGDSFNPRAALKFRPVPDLLFRMSYAEGFRAPSLLELHKSGAEDQAFLNDPCGTPSNVGVLSPCAQQTDPTG
ncbi:MAG: TonB-dependent receptor, partial [Pseudomonadales bacterium]